MVIHVNMGHPAEEEMPLVVVQDDATVLTSVELELKLKEDETVTTDEGLGDEDDESEELSLSPEEGEDESVVKAKEAKQNRAALMKTQREDHHKLHHRPRKSERRTSWAHTSATSRMSLSTMAIDLQTVLSDPISSDALPLSPVVELTKIEKHVSFGKVDIRVHHLTLGDNPGVSNGVPLQMEWEHDGSETYNLNDVKDNTAYAQKFTSSERYRIALRKTSKSLIAKEIKQVAKIQDSRKKSQKDETTDVETFLASRRKQQPPQPKKKVLWWYHSR